MLKAGTNSDLGIPPDVPTGQSVREQKLNINKEHPHDLTVSEDRITRVFFTAA